MITSSSTPAVAIPQPTRLLDRRRVPLVPFLPRSFDVWTLEKAAKLVDEMRLANPALRAYAFRNRTDPRGQDNLEAAEVLQETRRYTSWTRPSVPAKPSAMLSPRSGRHGTDFTGP